MPGLLIEFQFKDTIFEAKKLKSVCKKEEGFSLVEILVVILIIGILTAIAIPVFLNQRKVANDAAVESDVKNMMPVADAYFNANPTSTIIDINFIKANGTKSTGTIVYMKGNANDYCIWGQHVNGKKYNLGDTWAQAGGRPYYLISNSGGGYVNGTAISSLSCNTTGTHVASWAD